MFYFSFLHFPLSGPVLTNISLPIIPCMIVYVTNNKEPWTLNLRKRLQGLGSASSFYAYILLFHFCLLINSSRMLIIPLPGALHKALRAEKAILAPPKQLRRRQSTETGHASLKECNIIFQMLNSNKIMSRRAWNFMLLYGMSLPTTAVILILWGNVRFVLSLSSISGLSSSSSSREYSTLEKFPVRKGKAEHFEMDYINISRKSIENLCLFVCAVCVGVVGVCVWCVCVCGCVCVVLCVCVCVCVVCVVCVWVLCVCVCSYVGWLGGRSVGRSVALLSFISFFLSFIYHSIVLSNHSIYRSI